jgi:hypothetical protein
VSEGLLLTLSASLDCRHSHCRHLNQDRDSAISISSLAESDAAGGSSQLNVDERGLVYVSWYLAAPDRFLFDAE